MNHKPLSLWLLPPLTLALAACQVGTDPELEIAEGAAYLSVSEDEADDLGAEGLADEDNAPMLDELAGDEADGLPDPSLADGVGECSFEGLRARVIQSYDADGDGTLSRAERRTLRADIDDFRTRHPRLARLAKLRRHARFHLVRWAFDENNDRVLDETERQALVDALEARCLARRAALLEAFDANGNGTLDPDELAAAREARRARLAAARARILEAFDANGDGVLDPAERDAWKAEVRARIAARKAELKETFDTDGDGQLSEAERAAAKAAVRERITNPEFPRGA